MSLATVHYLSMIGRGGRLDDVTSTGLVGDEVSLSVSSLDPTADYGFDWGDETTTWATSDSQGIVSSAHTYTEEGSYSVRVFEDFGAGRTVFQYAVTQEHGTGGSIELLDEEVVENTAADFGFSGLSPNADLVVVWGDGTTDSFTADEFGAVSGPHTYDSWGDYVIRVIDDEDDPEDPQNPLASLSVTVQHRIGELEWDVFTTVEGEIQIVEDAANLLTGSGLAFNREYTIDWNDAEDNDTVTSDEFGGISFEHTYAAVGSYIVTVADGDFTAATLTFAVVGAPE